jgi:hypothetical protein
MNFNENKIHLPIKIAWNVKQIELPQDNVQCKQGDSSLSNWRKIRTDGISENKDCRTEIMKSVFLLLKFPVLWC